MVIAYRDKKVVGVFVRFRAPLQCSIIAQKLEKRFLFRSPEGEQASLHLHSQEAQANCNFNKGPNRTVEQNMENITNYERLFMKLGLVGESEFIVVTIPGLPRMEFCQLPCQSDFQQAKGAKHPPTACLYLVRIYFILVEIQRKESRR
jgi:hypothetical protein